MRARSLPLKQLDQLGEQNRRRYSSSEGVRETLRHPQGCCRVHSVEDHGLFENILFPRKSSSIGPRSDVSIIEYDSDYIVSATYRTPKKTFVLRTISLRRTFNSFKTRPLYISSIIASDAQKEDTHTSRSEFPCAYASAVSMKLMPLSKAHLRISFTNMMSYKYFE